MESAQIRACPMSRRFKSLQKPKGDQAPLRVERRTVTVCQSQMVAWTDRQPIIQSTNVGRIWASRGGRWVARTGRDMPRCSVGDDGRRESASFELGSSSSRRAQRCSHADCQRGNEPGTRPSVPSGSLTVGVTDRTDRKRPPPIATYRRSGRYTVSE